MLLSWSTTGLDVNQSIKPLMSTPLASLKIPDSLLMPLPRIFLPHLKPLMARSLARVICDVAKFHSFDFTDLSGRPLLSTNPL